MLWLAVHLPDFSLEIASRGAPEPKPLVITEGQGREERVIAANIQARDCGVSVGMRVSEAHALVLDLTVRPRDRIAEQEALARLAAWCGRYTSMVNLAAPDALLLEVGGSRKLYGGIACLTEQLRAGLQDLGYGVRLAIAPTPLAALWLAHVGRETMITDHSALFGALSGLPLECIGLDADGERLLKGLGLETVVDCLRLPRDGIARRVGPEILERLDRALGRLPDPRGAFVPPARFRARLGLPAPVATREALLFPLHRLLLELAGFLATRGAGAAELAITLHSTRVAATHVTLKLTAPSRDAEHLTALVRERLERLTLAAPVEEVILEVDTMLALAPQPSDFFARTTPPDTARAQIVERLQARLGREAVRGIESVPEHRPERAWREVEPGAPVSRDAVSASERRWPLWLLPAPLPIETRGAQPYYDGALALEPERERIESGWWDDAEVARDYFIARDPHGRRLWVFRELTTAQWFVHGVFG